MRFFFQNAFAQLKFEAIFTSAYLVQIFFSILIERQHSKIQNCIRTYLRQLLHSFNTHKFHFWHFSIQNCRYSKGVIAFIISNIHTFNTIIHTHSLVKHTNLIRRMLLQNCTHSHIPKTAVAFIPIYHFSVFFFFYFNTKFFYCRYFEGSHSIYHFQYTHNTFNTTHSIQNIHTHSFIHIQTTHIQISFEKKTRCAGIGI